MQINLHFLGTSDATVHAWTSSIRGHSHTTSLCSLFCLPIIAASFPHLPPFSFPCSIVLFHPLFPSTLPLNGPSTDPRSPAQTLPPSCSLRPSFHSWFSESLAFLLPAGNFSARLSLDHLSVNRLTKSPTAHKNAPRHRQLPERIKKRRGWETQIQRLLFLFLNRGLGDDTTRSIAHSLDASSPWLFLANTRHPTKQGLPTVHVTVRLNLPDNNITINKPRTRRCRFTKAQRLPSLLFYPLNIDLLFRSKSTFNHFHNEYASCLIRL